MPVVYLITKNKGKLMAARKAFDRFNIELMTLNVSYPEIQSDSSIDVKLQQKTIKRLTWAILR